MVSSPASAPRPPGRPRSEAARRRILQAANELLTRDGFVALTMEAIASKAKVSKATLYRWWSTKAAVVMDGFLAANEPRILFPDTGSVREDIRHQMHRLVELFASQTGRTIAALIAEGQTDPELAEAFRSRWLSIRRIEAKQVLERGIARGELRSDLDDLDVVLDALYGPIYCRLLVGHAPLDADFVNRLADFVINGISAQPATAANLERSPNSE